MDQDNLISDSRRLINLMSDAHEAIERERHEREHPITSRGGYAVGPDGTVYSLREVEEGVMFPLSKDHTGKNE